MANITQLSSLHGTFQERIKVATGKDITQFRKLFDKKESKSLIQFLIHNNCGQECNHCWMIESEEKELDYYDRIYKICDFFENEKFLKYIYPKDPLTNPVFLKYFGYVNCNEISTNLITKMPEKKLISLLRNNNIHDVYVSLHGDYLNHAALTNIDYVTSFL